MKKVVLAFASAALALSCVTASAGDLKGFGSAACGELFNTWINASSNTRSVVVVGLGQWAFGYFSGRNSEVPQAKRKELRALDNDETARFILEECQSHPNLRVYQIADIVYDSAPYLRAGV